MQHWLKTINPESDPFCEPFESMLQTKSREQPDNEPVAVTQARKAAQDKVKAAEQEQALASPSAGASTDPAGSQRAASPAQVGPQALQHRCVLGAGKARKHRDLSCVFNGLVQLRSSLYTQAREWYTGNGCRRCICSCDSHDTTFVSCCQQPYALES